MELQLLYKIVFCKPVPEQLCETKLISWFYIFCSLWKQDVALAEEVLYKAPI